MSQTDAGVNDIQQPFKRSVVCVQGELLELHVWPQDLESPDYSIAFVFRSRICLLRLGESMIPESYRVSNPIVARFLKGRGSNLQIRRVDICRIWQVGVW